MSTAKHASAAVGPRLSRADGRFVNGFKRWWPYYLMMSPGLIFFLVWHYVPIWEAKMAFEQVRIIPPNIWVGLKTSRRCSSPRCFTKCCSIR